VAGEARDPARRRPARAAWLVAGTLIVVLIAILVISLASGGGNDSSSDGTAAEARSDQITTIESFGNEASPDDRAAATAAVQDFLRAWIHRDTATACSLMAASTKKNLAIFAAGYKTCMAQAEAVRSGMSAEMLARLQVVEVTGVRVEGNRGFVLYRAHGGTLALPVLREGSDWKVGAIAGQPVQ
jgi:hypothetical protein